MSAKLTKSQEEALRAVAEHGDGCRISQVTGDALERRGLVESTIFNGTYRLTHEGAVQALALWRERAAEFEAARGTVDGYTADLIARLQARVSD